MNLESIYQQHYRQVYHQAWKLTRCREDAEDLAQDAFLIVARKMSSFRGECALSSWIYRIVLNLHLMKRRGYREMVELKEVQVVPVMPDYDLRRAAEELPAGQRTIVCFRLLGYRHEEIAEETGITVGASRSQLNHAIVKLRKRLAA